MELAVTKMFACAACPQVVASLVAACLEDEEGQEQGCAIAELLCGFLGSSADSSILAKYVPETADRCCDVICIFDSQLLALTLAWTCPHYD